MGRWAMESSWPLSSKTINSALFKPSQIYFLMLFFCNFPHSPLFFTLRALYGRSSFLLLHPEFWELGLGLDTSDSGWILCFSLPLFRFFVLGFCLCRHHVSDPPRDVSVYPQVCQILSRPLLRVNCRLVYYALQIMHYLNGGGGVGRRLH